LMVTCQLFNISNQHNNNSTADGEFVEYQVCKNLTIKYLYQLIILHNLIVCHVEEIEINAFDI